jgi:O-antigen/teichoic acid export membrane protein
LKEFNKKSSNEIVPLKTVLKGAQIVFLGGIFSRLLTYFTRVFIARYFGPEDYGLFSLGLAIVTFVGIFTLIGLPTGVQRYVPYFRSKNQERKVKGVLIFSLSAVTLISLFFATILIAAAPFISTNIFENKELENVIKIFALSIPFSSLTMVILSTFVGFKKIEYRIYIERIILNLLKLIFILLLGLLGYGALGIVFAYSMATALAFIIAFYLLESKLFSLRTMLQPIYIKGIYNAAIPTAQLQGLVVSSLGGLFLPVITELYAKGHKESIEIVSKTVTKWAVYLNFPIFLILFFFSGQILNLIFGTEYLKGSLALSILALGFFMRAFSFTPNSVLTMAKKTRVIFIISLTATLINILFNLVFIPRYGIQGAAIATTTTYIVNSFLLIGYSGLVLHVSTLSKTMMKSLPAGLLSMGVLYFVSKTLSTLLGRDPLFLLFPFFFFLYFILISLFGGLQSEDIEILKAVERRTGLRSVFLRKIARKFIK